MNKFTFPEQVKKCTIKPKNNRQYAQYLSDKIDYVLTKLQKNTII